MKQELITKENNRIFQIGSTFPIMSYDEIIGAIEFSKFLYKTDAVHCAKTKPIHKSLKKNNTIYTLDDIITEDKTMLKIKEQITKVAKTDSSVLIYGKTGTGKELVAQAIHNLSDRCHKPFISLNCAAIPSTLLESILFGTVKGSYTDATDRAGLFEHAEGGTLFLDEINSMDTAMQVKILKAIEDRYIRRVGDTKNIIIDIRIISAINENPDKLIETHGLREDLYYRLSTVFIELPVLKERKEDITVLINHYLSYYNDKMKIKVKEIQPQVLELFYKYDWPGNVRELRNVIESFYNNVAENGIITTENLSDKIKKSINKNNADENTFNDYKNHKESIASLKDAVEMYEQQLIKKALAENQGVASHAAKALKISKQTLQYKIDKYHLGE
ncbi:sigma-54 interaction domain-containing protein [Aminipila terrae]|uniref:AAA domain-containing protein n=1 Tax=Aminipila terrae TaxID=2697030 RepID=A0A6P1MMV6_9FIRM|nr:sigma 54-interacting transcriptional regulator [Aminipila terrae]QHI72345.1 AAA domain-containing protein [Aminipila terrae]